MMYYFIVAKEWCGVDTIKYKTNDIFDMISYALNFIKTNDWFNDEKRKEVLEDFISSDCEYVEGIFLIAQEEN